MELGLIRVSCAALLVTGLAAHAEARPQEAPRKSVDEVMTALRQKYKQADGKYDDLAKRIEKEVRAAIDAQVWLAAPDGGTERHFKEHPAFAVVNALAEAAKGDAKKRSKNAPETQDLLARFPWDKDLELVQGLEYGSDRAIPDHENGVINLGSADTFP